MIAKKYNMLKIVCLSCLLSAFWLFSAAQADEIKLPVESVAQNSQDEDAQDSAEKQKISQEEPETMQYVTLEEQQQIPIVRENTFHGQLPPKFRSSRMMYVTMRANGKGEGLNFLRVSGSDQFSEPEFRWIVEHVGTPIAVVDLRDDAHVFADGASVAWKEDVYTMKDQLLMTGSLSDKQALLKQRERSLLDEIKINEKLPLPLVKVLRVTKAKTGNYFTKINTKSNEENMLKEYGAEYFRLPLAENDILDSEAVDAFLSYYAHLPKGTWVHFHCQNGDKKTALYILLCDILQNADIVSLADMVERNAAVPPFIDFGKLRPWERPGGIFKNKVDVSDYLAVPTRLYDYTRRVNIYGWRPSGQYISVISKDTDFAPPITRSKDDFIFYPSKAFERSWLRKTNSAYLRMLTEFYAYTKAVRNEYAGNWLHVELRWKPTAEVEQMNWLESFCEFSKARKKGYGGNWSEWQRGVGVDTVVTQQD